VEAARGLRRLGRHVLRKRLTGGRGGGFGAAQVLDRVLERIFHLQATREIGRTRAKEIRQQEKRGGYDEMMMMEAIL